ncbi:hypothetical protein Hanom_Chr03g00274691 [Helianthus anomalus]
MTSVTVTDNVNNRTEPCTPLHTTSNIYTFKLLELIKRMDDNIDLRMKRYDTCFLLCSSTANRASSSISRLFSTPFDSLIPPTTDIFLFVVRKTYNSSVFLIEAVVANRIMRANEMITRGYKKPWLKKDKTWF